MVGSLVEGGDQIPLGQHIFRGECGVDGKTISTASLPPRSRESSTASLVQKARGIGQLVTAQEEHKWDKVVRVQKLGNVVRHD